MKKLFAIFLVSLLMAGITVMAQVKIGLPAGAPNSSSILDLNAAAANKGLLLPSVALTSTTSPAPLSSHVSGMMVYNTASVGNVAPGLYVNNGTKWQSITPAITDQIRAAIVSGANSTDLNNYDGAVIGQLLNISSASYSAIQAMTGASTLLQTNGFMAGTPATDGFAITGGPYTTTVPAASFTGPYFSSGQYLVAFSIKKQYTSRNWAGWQMKFGSAPSGTFSNYGTAFTSLSDSTSALLSYFIYKKPNALPNTPTMAFYNGGGTEDLFGAADATQVSGYFATGNSNNLDTLNSAVTYKRMYMQAITVSSPLW